MPGLFSFGSRAWHTVAMAESMLRDVYFEFTPIGHAVRVAAVCGETGTEVVVVAPAGTARATLEQLALRKLSWRLAQGAR
ncbi:hypothetical protein BN1110_02480 [bacterium YEK0313]|nr:hypothetical protein BN1110_02480 [bacterium YEK0313]